MDTLASNQALSPDLLNYQLYYFKMLEMGY